MIFLLSSLKKHPSKIKLLLFPHPPPPPPPPLLLLTLFVFLRLHNQTGFGDLEESASGAVGGLSEMLLSNEGASSSSDNQKYNHENNAAEMLRLERARARLLSGEDHAVLTPESAAAAASVAAAVNSFRAERNLGNPNTVTTPRNRQHSDVLGARAVGFLFLIIIRSGLSDAG